MDDTILPMEARFDEGPDQRDEIVDRRLGQLQVIESSSGPGVVRRTARHIRRSAPDLFRLVVPVGGDVVGEQAGRRVTLRPGDLGLVDMSRPFACAHPCRRAILVTFPRALTGVDLMPLVATRIPGDRGVPALLSSVVRQLPRRLDEEPADPVRLGTALLDLLMAAFAGSGTAPETRQAALRLQVRAYIEANLADPDLTPGTLAAAHHVSVRYLHKLFRADGETVSGRIRQRRLERCRRDLLDSALRDRPVGAIGARWGLRNPAHLSRLFRETYGLPPAEYRATHTVR